ncbi:hypothetical protein [Cryobacterium glucosi]|uniref:Uncharacterized protein n=1 Tax=Cryobacterium glucosi TaxID=1259175 RepID=A0ABY2INR4_9MICO|nr:hypothetical protein [Cryobacterium glucosi]TFC21334.1 hypothetical protein E3O46_06975 [Cryobacterium glucosi]
MSEIDLTAVLFAAGRTLDEQRAALDGALDSLPFDESQRLLSEALLQFSDLALSILETAVALGGDAAILVRAIVDDHLAREILTDLDDDLDDLGLGDA